MIVLSCVVIVSIAEFFFFLYNTIYVRLCILLLLKWRASARVFILFLKKLNYQFIFFNSLSTDCKSINQIE